MNDGRLDLARMEETVDSYANEAKTLRSLLAAREAELEEAVGLLRQIARKLERKEMTSSTGFCEWAKIDRNDEVIEVARAFLSRHPQPQEPKP